MASKLSRYFLIRALLDKGFSSLSQKATVLNTDTIKEMTKG